MSRCGHSLCLCVHSSTHWSPLRFFPAHPSQLRSEMEGPSKSYGSMERKGGPCVLASTEATTAQGARPRLSVAPLRPLNRPEHRFSARSGQRTSSVLRPGLGLSRLLSADHLPSSRLTSFGHFPGAPSQTPADRGSYGRTGSPGLEARPLPFPSQLPRPGWSPSLLSPGDAPP